MQAIRCKLNLITDTVSFYDNLLTPPLRQKTFMSQTVTAVLSLIILSRSEAIVPLILSLKFVLPLTIIESHLAMSQQHCCVARAIVQPETRKIACRISNPTNQPKVIRKNCPIAVCKRTQVLFEFKNLSSKNLQTNKTSKSKSEVLTKEKLNLTPLSSST